MAFHFKSATCIAVGTFNIYIFQPHWVGKLLNCPDGTPIKIETDFSQPGLKLSAEQFATWIVRPDRLVIEARDEQDDPGAAMANVIRALPLTPLRAIGANAVFETRRDELSKLSGLEDHQIPEMPEGHAFGQQTWHIQTNRGDQQFNLQLSLQEDSVTLGMNVHTDLTGKGWEFAERCARNFLQFRRDGLELMQHFWGAPIEHAADN